MMVSEMSGYWLWLWLWLWLFGFGFLALVFAFGICNGIGVGIVHVRAVSSPRGSGSGSGSRVVAAMTHAVEWQWWPIIYTGSGGERVPGIISIIILHIRIVSQ